MAPRPFSISSTRSNSNTLNIEGVIQAALKKGTAEFAKEARQWIKVVKKDKRSLEKAIEASNRQVAEKVKASMLKTYHEERKGNTISGYRQKEMRKKNRRYSSGEMIRAINSDAFVSARKGSVVMVDFTALKREVPHWYRLNFGSGRTPSSANLGEIRLNVFGQRPYIGSGISLAGWKASKPNMIPDGFFLGRRFDSSAEAWAFKKRAEKFGWRTTGKRSAFYLDPNGRKGAMKLTRPTKAFGFLEAGIKTANQEYAKAVSAILRDARATFRAGGDKRMKIK